MRIAVDVKNLAIYSGGISHFFRPLLRAWIENRKDDEFILIGPEFDSAFLEGLPNYVWKNVPFWRKAPGPLKHPIYDLFFAPMAFKRAAPDLYFSPYYDILIPKKLTAIITVHDLCFSDTAHLYPIQLRWYYLGILRRNIRMADRIITVSNTSKMKIIEKYHINPRKIHVVYNSTESNLFDSVADNMVLKEIRSRHQMDGYFSILYPGGLEYRKNIDQLIDALDLLGRQHDLKIKLLITGTVDMKSLRRWRSLKRKLSFQIIFTGFLQQSLLMRYYQAVDTVVYLSACEGFGRICLESMAAGSTLVCSDLSVFHEIAENYPLYCNPDDPQDIAMKIRLAFTKKRALPVKVPAGFQLAANVERFLAAVAWSRR